VELEQRESQVLVGQARVPEDGKTDNSRGCHKDVAISNPLTPSHGMPSPTLVTPEEKGKEMAKCLLGLKFSNCIKWYAYPRPPLSPHLDPRPPIFQEGGSWTLTWGRGGT
jgi:hypothetical protein